MTTLIDVQYIKNEKGLPEYAIIPYALFKKLTKSETSNSIPHEVVGKVAIEGLTPIRAWREYKNFTQVQIAERMGITQAAFSQMENSTRINRSTKTKIAIALEILPDQLDI